MNSVTTLYAACVMPDHVHLLLEPAIKETKEDETVFFSLGEIFHSIKAHTARAINQERGDERARSGKRNGSIG